MINNDKEFIKEANICTIINFIFTLTSYLLKKDILMSLSIFLFFVIFTIFYCYKKVHKKFITIENKKIDILPLIDPIKKEDHTLIPKHIIHKHIVANEEVTFLYYYEGICISKNGEDNIVFNIGAEEYIPFNELKCFAYDLKNDIHKEMKISPILIGDDGLSKKIKINFLHKLEYSDNFKILFVYSFPHCLKFGKDYISVYMSYYKKTIDVFINEIIFKDIKPLYVKVYDIHNKKAHYTETLKPNVSHNEYKYIHKINNCKGNTSIIYFINRER